MRGQSRQKICWLLSFSRFGNKHFRVIDEAKDCLSLFDKLNETLTASWDYMHEEAKKYYKQYGNLEIPKRYKTSDGYSLKEWLRTQRNNRVKGTFPNDRIEHLNKIGMDWLSPAARNWEMYFSACEKYYMTYGNLEIGMTYIDKNGLCIGRWLKNQRKNKTKLKSSGENGNQIKREHRNDLGKYRHCRCA